MSIDVIINHLKSLLLIFYFYFTAIEITIKMEVEHTFHERSIISRKKHFDQNFDVR